MFINRNGLWSRILTNVLSFYMITSNVMVPSAFAANTNNSGKAAVIAAQSLDSDEDGLTDKEEAKYKTDAHNPDTDNDGLADGDEVHTFYTDPLKADSDGDGISDGDEVSKYATDPLVPNTLPIAVEPGVGPGSGAVVPADTVVDTDGDGISDADETNLYQTDPTTADSDNDGLSDGLEINELHSNPLVADLPAPTSSGNSDATADTDLSMGISSAISKTISGNVSTNSQAIAAEGVAVNQLNAGCMKEQKGDNTLQCTANDVSIATATNIQITDDGCQNPNDTISFNADFQIKTTSTTRYDVGIYFSRDGDPNSDGALGGQCSINILPTTPVPPWLNSDNDLCGDTTSARDVFPTVALTIPCSAVNSNTSELKLPYCTSWDNNANTTCNNESQAVPGTGSKCKCDNAFKIINFPGKIVAKKVTYAGDSTEFQIRLTGPSSYDQTQAVTANDATGVSFNSLTPGTYDISEVNIPSGWSLQNTVCSDGTTTYQPNAIALASGKVVTCTFTNDNRAHIRVTKVTQPSSDSTSFAFTTTGNGYNGFNLSNGQTNDQFLTPGSYSVAETANSNYVTTSVCTDGASTVSASNLNLQAGHTINCTFTNKKKGTITVEKQTDPDKAAGSFTFSGDLSGSIGDGETIVSDLLAPGTYTVTESDPSPNFALSTIVCDDGSSATPSTYDIETRTATLKLDPGENIKCVFTNAQQKGTIIIQKDTQGGNGAFDFTSETLGDFSLTTVGGTTSQSFTNLLPGSYDVAETVSEGWKLLSSTCSDGSSINAISLQANETVTCTFTNAKLPKLRVVKSLVPSDDAGKFDLMIDTTTYDNSGAGYGNNGNTDYQILEIGSHNVAEVAHGTTNLSDYSSSISCDSDKGSGSGTSLALSLDYGDVVTCTITNTRLDSDIEVVKTADPVGPVSAGDDIGFLITVTNNGPGTATSVTLEDVLPTTNGLDWSIDGGTAASDCSILLGSLACSFGDMAKDAIKTVHIKSATTKESCAKISNTATVATTNHDSNTENNSSTADVTVNCANIDITKTADAESVSAGDQIGFTITVTNNGAGLAKDVTVSDTLPTTAGTSYTIDGAANGFSINAGVLSFGPADLAAGASVSVHIVSETTKESCGTITNTASVSTTNDGSDEASASVDVLCPDLKIEKSADETSVNAGDSIGFTITVSNAGPGVLHDATLNDPLPAGVTWSIDLQDADKCEITGAVGSQVLSCNIGDLAVEGSYAVHVTAATSAEACIKYDNEATASASNDDDEKASASITCNAADIDIEKTADLDSVSAGDQIGFTITVTNNGSGTAKGVVVEDILPVKAGTSYTIDGAANGFTINAGVLSYGPADLAAGASVSVHIISSTTKESCGTINNTASVTTTNDGSDRDDATVEVLCPDMHVQKDADATTVNAGDAIGFSITVSNAGPGVLHDATLNDPLPAGVTWSIDLQDADKCEITGAVGSQVLSCNIGDLASGGSYTVHVTAQTSAEACTTYNNLATASASNDDDEQDGASITCNAADIDIEKTADLDSVSAGDQIGFTITVTNNGSGTAKSVVVEDILPVKAGTSYTIDGAAIGFSINAGVLSFGPADLAAGESVSVHIVSETTKESCGMITNTASVSTTNDGDDEASASVEVQCATLKVTKIVINDHGGTLDANSVPLFVDSSSVVNGETNTYAPGVHVVSETQQAGYTATFSGDCDENGNVTLQNGDAKECIITNDDNAPGLFLRKVVVNDNGGSKAASDWTLSAGSNSVTGSVSGAKATDQIGTYDLSESVVAGYANISITCDDDPNVEVTSVTIGLGETKTCTFVNDDQQAFVKVTKVVINDNGGSALADDFRLTLDGNATTSEELVAVNPGVHTASETPLPGYSFTGFSGDCDENGSVTVALGETKECVLTNDDQQAYVKVTKVVINNNVGSAAADDFQLTLDGQATLSGALIPVAPGTYVAGETLLPGYSFTGFSGDCDANGSVTVALGETKECVLTNDDIALAGCGLTQGYWKTHSCAWPDQPTVNQLITKLGLPVDKNIDKSDLIAIMNLPTVDNACSSLAQQVIAAWLNVLVKGASIEALGLPLDTSNNTLLAASEAFGSQCIADVSPSGKITLNTVAPESAAGTVLIGYNNLLTDFNEGALPGIGHCANEQSCPATPPKKGGSKPKPTAKPAAVTTPEPAPAPAADELIQNIVVDPGCSCNSSGAPMSSSNWMSMGLLFLLSLGWRVRRRQKGAKLS